MRTTAMVVGVAVKTASASSSEYSVSGCVNHIRSMMGMSLRLDLVHLFSARSVPSSRGLPQ